MWSLYMNVPFNRVLIIVGTGFEAIYPLEQGLSDYLKFPEGVGITSNMTGSS